MYIVPTMSNSEESMDERRVTDISLHENGVMYLQDPISREWVQYYFVLSATKLCYMTENQ